MGSGAGTANGHGARRATRALSVLLLLAGVTACETPAVDPVSEPLDLGSSPAPLGRPCGANGCRLGLTCAPVATGSQQRVCAPAASRAGGAPCDEDRQCHSGSCDRDAGLCRAANGETCQVELGCARSDAFCFGPDPVCAPTDGEPGSPCRGTFECGADRICLDLGGSVWTCIGPAGQGQSCLVDAQCSQARWACRDPERVCRLGRDGETCRAPDECEGGACVQGRCADAGGGQPCAEDEDCGGLVCIEDRCQAVQRAGGPCGRNDHCLPELLCELRSCIDPTPACLPGGSDCPPGSSCQVDRLARPPERNRFECRPDGPAGLDEACAERACIAGLVCLDFGTGLRCRVPCQDECVGTEICVPLEFGGRPVGFGVCEPPR